MTKTTTKNWLKPLLVIAFSILYATVYVTPAFAALTTASVTLGDPRTGVVSTYTAAASGVSAATIGCVDLDIGANADGSGAVAGLATGSSTLDSFSLAGGTWAVDNTQSASHILRATNGTPASGTNGNVVWGTVTNGSTENTTYYGVLTSYTDNTCVTPVDTITLTFVYKNGELVSLTIDPSLTFTCVAVASGQQIFPVGAASETTTVASTGTGIDHASTVNSTTNGVSAHDLTTTTNASGGFNVYVRHTGLLTNGASDTIATGGLAAAAFTAAGTEGWAWTSDDSDIAGPLNGSGSGLWNSFSTTNAVIATEGNVASTTDRVGHQVGVSGTTPAGTYTTTIVYTAVAIY